VESNVATDGGLLQVEGLRKHFPIRRGMFSRLTGWVRAVDGVSFAVPAGKTLGLVGESGCGKTTVGRAVLRLLDGCEGRVIFDGMDVLSLDEDALRILRRRMQIIFQDPYSSLNPRITIGGMLGEIVKFHRLCEPRRISDRVAEILDSLGLAPQHSGRYPHEFSGGQRQRIGIARALSVEPDFIVLDEPVSALDVSIQAQIINLLMELQERLNLAYLFIAHDISVVEHIADEIAVMYLGRVVEIGPAAEIVAKPLHPYTRALMSAVPHPDPDFMSEVEPLPGDVPSPANPPSGCHFHPRCPVARPVCSEWEFTLKRIESRRRVGCIHY
jgi:oligopeptide transport system ATP-binding protein